MDGRPAPSSASPRATSRYAAPRTPGEPHELAASLDAGPVVQFVLMRQRSMRPGGADAAVHASNSWTSSRATTRRCGRSRAWRAAGARRMRAVLRPGRTRATIVLSALALMWLWTAPCTTGASSRPSTTRRACSRGLRAAGRAAGLGRMAGPAAVRSPGRPAAGAGLGAGAVRARGLSGTGRRDRHSYPGAPTFGITPCPVTLFTFGLLLLATTPVPWLLLVIPVAWSLVGGSGLPAAGAAGLAAARQRRAHGGRPAARAARQHVP